MHPAGTMASGAKGLFHCCFRAHRYIGAAPHITGDEDWLTYILVNLGDIGVLGREGSGCPLAVNAERLFLAIGGVFLYLGDVMTYVVDLL
ncbi:hypothetical protein ES703_67109 [subsurface metagenome]